MKTEWTEQEKAYLEAAAREVERQMEENPNIAIPVDPDVAEYMGAVASEEDVADVLDALADEEIVEGRDDHGR